MIVGAGLPSPGFFLMVQAALSSIPIVIVFVTLLTTKTGKSLISGDDDRSSDPKPHSQTYLVGNFQRRCPSGAHIRRVRNITPNADCSYARFRPIDSRSSGDSIEFRISAVFLYGGGGDRHGHFQSTRKARPSPRSTILHHGFDYHAFSSRLDDTPIRIFLYQTA
jgi:hypothetical protein